GAGGGGGSSSDGAGSGKSGSRSGPSGAAGKPTVMHPGDMAAGAECPDIGLPSAYGLPNLKAEIDGSTARITFDPQGDAADYRVYALPKKEDVSGSSIKNAVYRCAGGYAVPAPAIDDAKMPENPGIRTKVTASVKGYSRTMKDDATLGYVFTTPADDRVPVYALGDPDLKADNVMCYEMRWPESRLKKYTTSDAERADLISKRWRDDGIAFYAPKPGADGAAPIYSATETNTDVPAALYVADGPEHDQRKMQGYTLAESFSAYAKMKDGAEPLMRVHYEQTCARAHDELVAGAGRFNKAYQQGAQPVAELHFSGITEETTLVVEALDELCPFPGIISPTSRPARVDPFGTYDINYPDFLTPADAAAASPTGEVFIAGQGLEGKQPHAIARACVKVAPAKQPDADFRYDGGPETFSEPVNKGFQIWETESENFNVQLHTMATDEYGIGVMFGEIWATYADWAADTNGKLRITPKKRATLADDSFVHATMQVDTISTQRRYPQLMISSSEWPVQDNLEKGSTVLVQTFGGITIPLEVQIQFCDHRTWDVNNQCPLWDTYQLADGDKKFLSPHLEINGLNGQDRTVRFDAYVSTKRAYVFINNTPYGCVNLPEGRLGAGTATVTFADVLYHSDADLAAWYPFQLAKMHQVTSRHYSNLAFSSSQPAPQWDESIMPCVAASALK
ncbi:MAG TPA: hypothetical protein VEQ59_05665, partial [Polyangiaceae bacterium]|nr:hypothetical protein [Polyangiaceae bacterium]